jgi:ribulose-phosphate 3-epimerase
VTELIRCGAEAIQFDVMDGQFVPPITFGAGLIKALPAPENVAYEAHLMTLTPERHFEAFAEAGCSRIIFHVEATAHPHRLAGTLRDMDISPGIAINPGTPVEMVQHLLEVVDLVLVMTVNPGWGGQACIPECLSKVVKLRQLCQETGRRVMIEVDGGIDPSTILRCYQAGADHFVIGSFLNRVPSFEAAFLELKDALKSIL